MTLTRTDELLRSALREMIREEVAAALAAGPDRETVQVEHARGEVAGARRPVHPLADLDPYSLVPFAVHVLTEAGGGPLHASVMATRIYELGFQHRWPPKYPDQLVRSINALASPSQHPELFERVGPRTLRLR